MDINQSLSDNLKRLMKAAHQNGHLDLSNGIQLGKASGLGSNTVNRILRMRGAIRINTLETLAAAFGRPAWHLLVPHLDPESPPSVEAARIPDGPPIATVICNRDLVKRLGISRQAIHGRMKIGTFPEPVTWGWWRLSDVEEWERVNTLARKQKGYWRDSDIPS